MRGHQRLAGEIGLADAAVAGHDVDGAHEDEAVTVQEQARFERQVGALANADRGKRLGGGAPPTPTLSMLPPRPGPT